MQVRKIFKYIFISLLSAVVLFALSVFIVLNYFEEDVISFAKEKSKNYFISKVTFGTTALTYWKSFPKVALEIEDVCIHETFETNDTLFYAKKMYLEFGLMDLFRGKYNIHAVSARDGLGRMVVDKKGNDNWHFWKTTEESDESFNLELKKISIENVGFTFNHQKNDFFLNLFTESASGKGSFSSEQFALNVNMDGHLHRVENKKEEYAPNKDFSLKGILDANTKNSVYTFQKTNLTIEKMPFFIDGWVNTSKESALDLTIVSNKLDLKEVTESLSPSQRARFKDYAASGKAKATIKIKGKTYDANTPTADIHFTVSNGTLKHRPNNMKLEDLSCDMRYVTGEKEDVLSIRNIRSKMPTGFVDLQGVIRNLQRPYLDISLNTETELDNLKRFLSWDTLEICSGKITAKAHVTGQLKYNPTDSTYNWKELNTTGTAQLRESRLKLQNSNRLFSNMQSNLIFDNKTVEIQNFSGDINGSDFAIHGVVKNLTGFLTTKTERLSLSATHHSNLFNFTNLVESNHSENEYYLELPERIDFSMTSTIEKFIFRKFEATKVKGNIHFDGHQLSINPVAFATADGNFDARITLAKENNEQYQLSCLARLKDINIQKLFIEFENFDQTFITDTHLRGIANANVQFKTSLTKSLKMISKNVESLVDISIDNGQIIGLESFQEVAEYVRKNKLAAPFVNADKFAERLKSISFSRLENIIEIKNSTIIIPSMDIKSNVLDIAARGKHTFDNKIDYTIGFNLRDVLIKKEKEYQVEDDGLGRKLFVFMRGTTANPEYGIDKDTAKEVRQQQRQEEKENVKAILKEELGIFKKDKTIGSSKTKPSETKPTGTTTTIEWGDMDEKPATTKKNNSPTSEPTETPAQKQEEPTKKKTPKWLQEKN